MEGRFVRQVGVALALAACWQPAAPHTEPGVASYRVGPLLVEGAPPIDTEIARALAPYADVPSTRMLDVSPDASRVLVARGGDIVELGGADPIVRVPDVDVVWARYGRDGTIAYVADRDGDEDLHLVIDGGEVPTGGRIVEPVWDRERRRLAWIADGVLHIAEGKGIRELRLSVTASGAWAALDVSPDGAFVLLRQELSSVAASVFRVRVADRTVEKFEHARDGRFGTRGELFLVTTTEDRDGVEVIDATGARSTIIGGGRMHAWPRYGSAATAVRVPPGRIAHHLAGLEIEGEVSGLAMLGDLLAVIVEIRGRSTLILDDTLTGVVELPNTPTNGIIEDLRAESGVLGFTFTDSTHPRSAMTYDPHRRLTRTWAAGDASAIAAVAPEVVRIGEIDALVYRRRGRGRAPVVVAFHGGPEDRWEPRYRGFVQFLVARGYAVIEPNVRGSTGRGHAYAALDDREHRGDVLGDVGDVLAWIEMQRDLDPERVAVSGFSYGGWLALAAAAEFRSRVCGAIDLAGITDFVGFLEHTAGYRRDHRRAEYGDERDPKMRAVLAALSPNPAQMRRPLLVAHGARDPRVAIGDVDRFVAGVRAAGTAVWYLRADDEGHGFSHVDSRGVYETLVVQFLGEACR